MKSQFAPKCGHGNHASTYMVQINPKWEAGWMWLSGENVLQFQLPSITQFMQ